MKKEVLDAYNESLADEEDPRRKGVAVNVFGEPIESIGSAIHDQRLYVCPAYKGLSEKREAAIDAAYDEAEARTGRIGAPISSSQQKALRINYMKPLDKHIKSCGVCAKAKKDVKEELKGCDVR